MAATKCRRGGETCHLAPPDPRPEQQELACHREFVLSASCSRFLFFAFPETTLPVLPSYQIMQFEFEKPTKPTAQIKSAFAELGFVRLKNVIAEEARLTLTHELSRLITGIKDIPTNQVWYSNSAEGKIVVQRISRANILSPFVESLGKDSILLKEIAAFLLDCPITSIRCADGREGSDGAVFVIKDPNNITEHNKLRWHYDGRFTRHLDINPFINVGLYLDAANSSTGALVVLPQSQSSESAFIPEFEETTEEHPGELTIEANARDAVFHSCQLWHCSRSNVIHGSIRRILYFNFYDSRSR